MHQHSVKPYLFEAKRHFGIIDAWLAQHEWMLGSEYSIVGISL